MATGHPARLLPRLAVAAATAAQGMLPMPVVLAMLAGSPGAVHAQARPYAVDGTHTTVYFGATHFGRSTVRGRFNRIDGRILYDPASGSGSLDVTVDTASVDSGLSPLDGVLRSPQFLDAQGFPYARLRAQRFIVEQGRLVAVEGELSLHGVTHPVRLEAERFSCGEEAVFGIRREACGGDFRLTLSRSAFGMTRFLPDVGDMVTLQIAIEATPAGPAEAPAMPPISPASPASDSQPAR